MSRREARETLNLREYRTAMEGIYSTSVNERTTSGRNSEKAQCETG